MSLERKITFLSDEQQGKAFGFMMHNGHGFKGFDINTVIVSQNTADELIKQGVEFRFDN